MATYVYDADNVTAQVHAALAEREPLLPKGFASDSAALRIAHACRHQADGTSHFWIARPRWTAASGRQSPRAVYEVLRSDGDIGVWDALTLDEGETVADVLTKLRL